METMLIIGTALQVVGSVSQGYNDAKALRTQAKLSTLQANLTVSNAERQKAVEKASAAEESLTRFQRMRRIVGSTLVRATEAGITIGSGSVGDAVDQNGQEFAREQGTRMFNLDQRLASINLNSAVEETNYRAAAASQKYQARQSVIQGWMNAATAIGSYGMNSANRGSTPGTTINWNDGTSSYYSGRAS